MPSLGPVPIEFLKTAFAGLTVILGAFLGARFWSALQKRRELQLAAADSFYKLYGDFFAIWKLWNFLAPDAEGEAHWDLLKRASAAEGGVEALFVRLVSERDLSDAEIENLGRFRQGYQTLREKIRINETIPWFDSEHPEYRSFKHLACNVALLLSSRLKLRLPDPARSSEALARITSNEWEGDWVIKTFTNGWMQDLAGNWFRIKSD